MIIDKLKAWVCDPDFNISWNTLAKTVSIFAG